MANWEVIWNMLRHQHRKNEERRRGVEKHLDDLELASELESLTGGGEFTNQRTFETLERGAEEYRGNVRKYGPPVDIAPIERARESVHESEELLKRAEEMLRHIKEQVFKNRFYGLRNQFGLTASKPQPTVDYLERSEDGNNCED